MQFLRFLPFVLLTVSLASFSWAMRRFFSQPSGDTSGMKLIRGASLASALLNVVAILGTPAVSSLQVVTSSALYVLALGIFFWAIRTNRQSPLSAAFSTDAPQRLTDSGPYRFVRHPFYSSYILTWTAGFACTGRWWLLPSVAMMVWIYISAAKLEEDKFAASKLAGEYERYRESTGRFFPNPFAWMKARRKEPNAASLA